MAATRKKLSKEKGGNVLIEFALLAPVFFMLVMGLVEFVLFQYKTYAMNHVMFEAARNLQTGEIRAAGNTTANFRAELCANAGVMLDCNQIDYDVRAYDALSQINFTSPTFDNDGRATNFTFQGGNASQYQVVRATMPHSFITPYMNELFRIGPNKPAIVNSYIVLRNEPWN